MQVRASHILVSTLNEAVALQRQINSGLPFEMIAKGHSKCPSSQRGGDLGTFSEGMMVKPFEDAVFAAPIGEVVGPVQTQFGFHLIKRTA